MKIFFELMIGDTSHFLFVNRMTTAELQSLKDADRAISKQAKFSSQFWMKNSIFSGQHELKMTLVSTLPTLEFSIYFLSFLL